MMKKLKIGPVETKNNVVLAPMAGVCNPAFRLIAKEFGTGLVCAEMVSDKAILHGNERTRKMLYVDEREKPLSLQIFGGDKESLVEAAKIVDRQTNADIIDINMGCPGAQGGQVRRRRPLAAGPGQDRGAGGRRRRRGREAGHRQDADRLGRGAHLRRGECPRRAAGRGESGSGARTHPEADVHRARPTGISSAR